MGHRWVDKVSHDAYAELAFAVLFWDRAEREGLRHEQVAARDKLHELAQALRDAGYALKVKE